MIALPEFFTDPRPAFHAWLDDFDAADNEAALLAAVSQCHFPLPQRYCDSLELPDGSTYRDAVEVVLSGWMNVK